MAAFAKAPNSCELNKIANRGWQIQAKPVGSDPTNYRYVRGITTLGVNIETSAVSSTDINSEGWETQEKTGRTLTIQADGQFATKGDLALLDESQQLLKVTGQETGKNGKVDVRVWREDIDEGWEATVTNSWTEGSGAPNELRTFSASMQASCVPTRIHSVEEGAHTEASVPVTDEEWLKILKPVTPPTGD